MTATARTAATAAIVLLVCSANALAARTDIIQLRNGDRVTGEVTQLRHGKLQVKTDDAGTLSIEWDKVAAITTAGQYDISMRDGSEMFGRFTPGTAGTLQVVGESGAASPAVMADVAFFARINRGFLDRIDGSLDLGGSYTKSSGVGELFFDSDATYRRPAYAYKVQFATNLTHQTEAPDTSRYSLATSYTRYHGSRWMTSALGLFESNRDLGFTFRGTGAGSIGRYFARTNHVEFFMAGGMAAGRETPLDDPQVTNIDGLVAANLSVFTYDYPTTSVDVAVLVFPSFDDPGRVRVNADGKFKRELFRDFFVALSFYDAFDNRPKSASARQNDVGGSLSFGWSF